jgi:hypothetical protein
LPGSKTAVEHPAHRQPPWSGRLTDRAAVQVLMTFSPARDTENRFSPAPRADEAYQGIIMLKETLV